MRGIDGHPLGVASPGQAIEPCRRTAEALGWEVIDVRPGRPSVQSARRRIVHSARVGHDLRFDPDFSVMIDEKDAQE